jgi:hypothetical protein
VVPRTIDALQNAVCGAIDDICHGQAVCFIAAGNEPIDQIVL